MGLPIWLALMFFALGAALSTWCLIDTTALSMTAFFMLGIPSFAMGGLLYVWTVVRDLRRHDVL